MDNLTVKTAEAIKNQFGDKLSIHTIAIGDDASGKALIKQIAIAGQGISEDAEKLVDPAAMAQYVKTVFLREALDTDGDGVYDHLDKCPDTEKGFKVDSVGCPIDSDRDGVNDEKDRCPQTPQNTQVDSNGCLIDTDEDGIYDIQDDCPDSPKGLRVNKKGCMVDSDNDGIHDDLDQCPETPEGATVNNEGCWYIPTFYFRTAKDDIELFKKFEDILPILLRVPTIKLIIEGHTDNVGKKESNMSLSLRRAKKVADYLIKNGIASSRIETIGFGPTRPAATNSSEQGRTLNRRVEFRLIQENINQ
jgi:OOP family OmpA-OmpF porin